MPEKLYALPESLASHIANYLASRPYAEVVKIMEALQYLQEVAPVEKEAPDAKK